ncbi:MAG: TIGR04282 family arsenosugar biosynthesis glycosyltransferase [Roseomonas sp.]|jgi:rSAM/selenodomain-associated transferase 1|nr:TIGR04282 family arsenosugar biosynthesis glycosyltransferase [Roseomonas sp.]
MRRPVVIIFARAPRLGAVKRRLAAGIGARGALHFYRATLAAIAWPITRDRRWRTILAITPRGARADWTRLAPPGTLRMAQIAGDLGQRMERALAPFPRAILIGSDIPGLGPADIAAGFRALGRADAVFGPALDGGYWLVGFGPQRPHKPFARVRWSSRHALADTLANFRRHRVALLPPKRDVDCAEDLAALRLPALIHPAKPPFLRR